MAHPTGSIILGSRSPRRLELLSQIVPREAIRVVPPRDAEEAGFDGLADWSEIQTRLVEIARAKAADVLAQVAQGSDWSAILTADTTIVGTSADGNLHVLGQPPEAGDWQKVVSGWFQTYYFGKTHAALTAVCVAARDGGIESRVVRTDVAFAADGTAWLNWYLETGEPVGKAGGYALQGAGSLFVERIEGSPSNVVGLPLRETAEMLDAILNGGFSG